MRKTFKKLIVCISLVDFVVSASFACSPAFSQLISPMPTQKQSSEFPTFPSLTKVEQVYIGGKPTVDDEITVTIKHPFLPSRRLDVSTFVNQGDTLISITRQLSEKINASLELKTVGVESWAQKTVLTIKSNSENGFQVSVRLSPQSTIVVHEIVDEKGELLESYKSSIPGATETARLGVNPSLLWYTVLSGDNSAVTSLINNRSISFEQSESTAKERAKAEIILRSALNCALTLNIPRDIINCLCNLGCFYYLGGDFTTSDKYFRIALSKARRYCSPDAPAIAEILEHGAMAARACASLSLEDYSRAESMYLEALQIRTSVEGFYKPDVAFAMMNLSCLYHDWGLQCEEPHMCKVYGQRARDLEAKVDELMNPNPHPNLAAITMQKAIVEHQKACPSHLDYDAESAWWHKLEARRLAKESYALASHMVSIDTLKYPNPPCARPYHPCLTVNNGYGQLSNMVAFAEGIIAKCHEEQKMITKREIRKIAVKAGVGTILGHWTIPTEVSEKSIVDTLKIPVTTFDGMGERVVTTKEEKASQLEGVQIYLCKFPHDRENLLYRMWRYGMERGLSRSEVGRVNVHGWPANHKQAAQIKRLLDDEANEIGFDKKLTDREGDFEFRNVPTGDYFLYASILTKKQFRVWLIPGEPDMSIQVRRLQQFRYDFVEKTGKLLWEDGHSVESQTPDSYFR